MMQKDLSKDRMNFRSYKVLCDQRVTLLVSCGGVTWARAEGGGLLARCGMTRAVAEGTHWEPVVGPS